MQAVRSASRSTSYRGGVTSLLSGGQGFLQVRFDSQLASKGYVDYDWHDPLNVESMLTSEEKQIRDAAQAYAQGELLPRIVQANRHETFDREIMTELGELGLLGATVSEEYGGAGVGYTSYGLVAREIERVDSSYRVSGLFLFFYLFVG